MTNLVEQLDRIIAEAEKAKVALADEHEGKVTEAIYNISVIATEIDALVTNW